MTIRPKTINLAAMARRNPGLLEKRNKRLCERWVYWTEDKRRRFDDVVSILANEEFYLSTATVERILQDHNDTITALLNKRKQEEKSITN